MRAKVTIRGPRSRRERPAKLALTRQGIIDAALTILKDEGLSKVTMRRIATALDTGAASLYVYLQDTEDLHAQILDALLEPLGVMETAGNGWRDRLKNLLISYINVLFAYPEMARMAVSTHPSGPHYLKLADTILALLGEGGVPDREASWAIDLLLLLATAVAAEQATRQSSLGADDEDSALAFEIAAADPQRYPQIARLGDDLLSGSGPDRFDWAIDVILAGVLQIRRPPSPDTD